MILTKKQRGIIADYEQLAAPSKVDVDRLPADTTARTINLLLTYHWWIRGAVIMKYTLMDEYLAAIIANYYFGKPRDGHYGKLWRRKKFQLFNHHVLDELFLLKKKEIVHQIKPLPKDINSKIQAINDVRNALAHSFFPENRRRYYKKGGVLYDGLDLFTTSGIEKFLNDTQDVIDVLHKRAV
jgi:hypothetical protein